MSLWPPMWFDLLHEGNFEAMGIEGNMGVEKGKNWEEEEMEEEKVEGERAAISSQLVSRSLALRTCNLLFNSDVKCHRAKISSYVIIAIVRRRCHLTWGWQRGSLAVDYKRNVAQVHLESKIQEKEALSVSHISETFALRLHENGEL